MSFSRLDSQPGTSTNIRHMERDAYLLNWRVRGPLQRRSRWQKKFEISQGQYFIKLLGNFARVQGGRCCQNQEIIIT